MSRVDILRHSVGRSKGLKKLFEVPFRLLTKRYRHLILNKCIWKPPWDEKAHVTSYVSISTIIIREFLCPFSFRNIFTRLDSGHSKLCTGDDCLSSYAAWKQSAAWCSDPSIFEMMPRFIHASWFVGSRRMAFIKKLLAIGRDSPPSILRIAAMETMLGTKFGWIESATEKAASASSCIDCASNSKPENIKC